MKTVFFPKLFTPRPLAPTCPVPPTEIKGTDDPEQEGEYDSSINNVVIRDMVLRNAGKECVRLQHFVTDSVIMDNEIRNCGITDFQVEDDGENGEGVCESWKNI